MPEPLHFLKQGTNTKMFLRTSRAVVNNPPASYQQVAVIVVVALNGWTTTASRDQRGWQQHHVPADLWLMLVPIRCLIIPVAVFSNKVLDPPCSCDATWVRESDNHS